MGRFYSNLSYFGFPFLCFLLLWNAEIRSDYEELEEKLYRITPSIPFRPYCVEEGNWGESRPIKNITMSNEYTMEVAKAIAEYGFNISSGMTLTAAYEGERDKSPKKALVLVSPELNDDTSTMVFITDRAMIALERKYPQLNLVKNRTPALFCKDIEGKITKF